MKAQRPMLMYLLVTLLICSIVSVPVSADGPWDVDSGGGSEARGGNNNGGLPWSTNSQDPVMDGDGDGSDGPNLVEATLIYLFYQVGFVKQATLLLDEPINKRQKTRRSDLTRR